MKKSINSLLKRILWTVSPGLVLRYLPPSRNQFAVGIYTGPTPFNLRPAAHVRNPVLTRADVTDAPAGTVADPFMIRCDGTWFMFFEILNQINSKGEIALATSKDGFEWDYSGIVLSEPFHMSYPQVFEWQGEFYMIPETGRHRDVRLYRAARFPYEWSLVTTLLEGFRIVDSSIVQFNNMWWLFADAGPDSRNPALRLYHAPDLLGPWLEHPDSPIVESDPSAARPGGRVVMIDGVPHRFAQSVYPVYGRDVRAFEICDLTTESYSERPIGDCPIIGPGDEGWNIHGMHHIDLHQVQDGSWLACVDGCVRRDFDESQLSYKS
jgi:hypothetical protein